MCDRYGWKRVDGAVTPTPRTIGQRLSARKARSAPIVAAFGEWLQAQRVRVSAKSVRRESRPPEAFLLLLTGAKFAYIHNHWPGLQTFLTIAASRSTPTGSKT